MIEVSRDNGEFYQEIIDEFNKDWLKVRTMKIKNACFDAPTFLLKSVKDLELLVNTIDQAKRLADLYDDEIKGFSFIWGEVYFPCFAVISGSGSMVHSVDDVQELCDNAASMLKLVKKGAK
jgi:hypothetical protein